MAACRVPEQDEVPAGPDTAATASVGRGTTGSPARPGRLSQPGSTEGQRKDGGHSRPVESAYRDRAVESLATRYDGQAAAMAKRWRVACGSSRPVRSFPRAPRLGTSDLDSRRPRCAEARAETPPNSVRICSRGSPWTIRLAGTVPDLHQILDGLLAGRHLRLEQSVQELSPGSRSAISAPAALRDPAFAIPLDGRRQFELSPATILVRGRIREVPGRPGSRS